MFKGWIYISFTLLAVLYAFVKPPFESPDEYYHFGMVAHIAKTGKLPIQSQHVTNPLTTPYMQQASQPPLFYLIAAGILAPFDDDSNEMWRINPHVSLGDSTTPYNKNFSVITFNAPNTLTGFYLIRLLSISLGLITIWSIGQVSRLIKPDFPPEFAMSLVAFNPMFLFITTAVTNDNLVTAFVSVAVVLLLQTLKNGFNTRRSIALAVVIALATLSKLSGLVLVPIVALTAIYIAYRDQNWRGLFVLGGLMASFWLLIAGWWYARNLMLYDELFGTEMMLNVFGRRSGYNFQTFLDELQGLHWSYWGVFGWFNLLINPVWFYHFFDVLLVTSLVGLILFIRQQKRETTVQLGILILLFGVGFGAFLQWTAQTSASQGRLLFPFNAAIVPLIAFGLFFLRRFWQGVSIIMLIMASVIPFSVIRPAYNPPPSFDVLPTHAADSSIQFGDAVALIGYELPLKRVSVGDWVDVTLYWQILKPTDRDYSLSLALITSDQQVISKLDTLPGGGVLRTSLWEPGMRYQENYSIQIEQKPNVNTSPLFLQISYFDFFSNEYLQAYTNGNPLPAVLLNAGGIVVENHPLDLTGITIFHTPISFGETVLLQGCAWESDQLRLLWESTSTFSTDYRVFVQIWEDSTIIAQGDAPPDLPTRYWLPGERYITTHQVTTSPTSEVRIGWYDPISGVRLNTNRPDNAYMLTRCH